MGRCLSLPIGRGEREGRREGEGTHRAPLATANLSSSGLQRTNVAARLMRSMTSVGFQTVRPVCGSGDCCHTYALRSCEAVTMRLELGAQSIEVMILSCWSGGWRWRRRAIGARRDEAGTGGTYLGQGLGGSPVCAAAGEDLEVVGVEADGDLCSRGVSEAA